MRSSAFPILTATLVFAFSPLLFGQEKAEEKGVEKPEKTEKSEEKADKSDVEKTEASEAPGSSEEDPATSKDTLVAKLSITEAERLMKSLELEFEEMDNGVYRFDLGDFKVLFYNKKQALQLYAGFTGFDVTLGRINEWNRTKRFRKPTSTTTMTRASSPTLISKVAFR